MLSNRRKHLSYWVTRLILILLVITTLFPFLMMLMMSLKEDIMIKIDFLGLPDKIAWVNYAKAFAEVIRPVGNSIFICFFTVVGVLILVSLSGYAFARFQFAGKEIIYYMIIGVMMIPTVLLIIPTYTVVNKLNLVGTFWACIFPYIAGQQLFGIMLTRSYFSSLPEELFESAQMEGATDFYMFRKIALPLSVPILITIGITTLVAAYNDYIWPTLVLTGGQKFQTFCQVAFVKAAGNGTIDMGMLTAFYVLGTIPLLIITASCLKYYLQGMIEGAVKG